MAALDLDHLYQNWGATITDHQAASSRASVTSIAASLAATQQAAALGLIVLG